jgi:glycosyltransferase involved in cell wall biosynthesis
VSPPVSSSVAVILPALNEEEALPFVLKELPLGLRVIVVDNGSEDNTATVAQQMGARVIYEPQRGYGSAVLAGLRSLEGAPPKVVVILDADHADRADLIYFLTEPILANQLDFLLADRTRSAEDGALTWPQRAGNAVACRLMQWSTGYRYQDMGPFRAIRWSSLTALNMGDPTWGWNVEMQMKAIQQGLRVREIPLPYRCRRAGESKISGTVQGAIRAGSRMLWAVSHYHKP